MSINRIHADTIEGYYPKDWTPEDYERQIDIMLSTAESRFDSLACESGEFRQISIFKRIFFLFIRCFGVTDPANQTRVASQQLKFFFHGEVNGLLSDVALKKLKPRINAKLFTDPSIQKLFRQIMNRHEGMATSQTLPVMRQILEDFHKENRDQLVPHFWSRMFGSHEMLEHRMRGFEDPHLELAQQALSSKNPDKAIQQLKYAALKGGSPEFIEKIGHELKHLMLQYKDHSSLNTHKILIHELFAKVAKSQSQNPKYTVEKRREECKHYLGVILEYYSHDCGASLKVGECYLFCGYYVEAAPWLQSLRESKSQDPLLQLEIARAYFHLGDTIKAIEVYEKAIPLLGSHVEVLNQAHSEIGKIYLTAQVANANEKAVFYLTKAFEANPQEEKYKTQLLQAYIQLFEESPHGFESRYGENFLRFFKRRSRDPLSIEAGGKVLLGCIKQCFSLTSNNQARAMNYFCPFTLSDDFVLAVCDIAIAQNAERMVSNLDETYIKMKERQSIKANPELYEKVGTFYWSRERNYALQLFGKALQGFETKKQNTSDPLLLMHYDQHLAFIHSKLAQHVLQTPQSASSIGGFLTNILSGPRINYEEAINYLRESVKEDPENQEYRNQLSNAFIIAAEKEKGYFQDTGKIISYYRQAYDCNPVNGPYLSELLTLYLDQNLIDNAAELFANTQTKSWAEQLELSASVWNRLGHANHRSDTLAVRCFKNARRLDKTNHQFVEDYYNRWWVAFAKQHRNILAIGDANGRINRFQTLICLIQSSAEGGFNNRSDLKETHEKTLALAYNSLAEAYIQKFTFEKARCADRDYRNLHSDSIFSALENYTKAIQNDPKNPKYHFEKALLLDFDCQCSAAFEEAKAAVAYDTTKNPFYLHLAGFIAGGEGKDPMEFQGKIPEYWVFENTYAAWYEDYLVLNKKSHIDPHNFKII